ncbi:alpha/beta hydrolase [Chitinophaga tropicalis]|uniref:Alpha/beta hydrolase fold domain-containing protein n=1 Tax=Chitinophaga tropicalis TaxID=2683588 RepID=A0A7K1UC62_9BACT|nr:alpha/beta hydrolase [Chitinophaga tropicalis]MVT11974.1 alpha/beta hydrolase fold domain-containing protein [Chitinophaga tropicalis]
MHTPSSLNSQTPLFLLLVLLFFLQGTGCSKDGLRRAEHGGDTTIPGGPTDTIPDDTAKPLAALEFLNEHYGTDSQQVMDIYLPAGRSKEITQIMVFIHGGGWMGSDKSDYTENINDMKNRDARYAYVNLNYRLVKDGKNQFPAAEEDIKAALEHVWALTDSFHISPLTAVIGVSAGAHLTALEAFKHNTKGYIRSVVCISGVYDMKRFHDEGSAGVAPLAVLVLGGTPEGKPELYYSSSPVNYVTEKGPSTLLMHGTEDTLARYNQALAMDSLLKKAGVVHEMYSYNGGHSIPAELLNEAADRMFTFVARYTK